MNTEYSKALKKRMLDVGQKVLKTRQKCTTCICFIRFPNAFSIIIEEATFSTTLQKVTIKRI